MASIGNCAVCGKAISNGQRHLRDLDNNKKVFHIKCYTSKYGELPKNIKHISYNPASAGANIPPQIRATGKRIGAQRKMLSNPKLSDISGTVKKLSGLTKEQISKLIEYADNMPTPTGYDEYFEAKIWPKLKKVGKGIIIGGSIAQIISGVGAIGGIATLIARRTQKIKKLEAKAFDKLHDSVKYTLGRLIGVSALYISNGKDFKKTISDLRSASNPMPRIRVDFTRLDVGRVVAAAVSLADGIAGIFYLAVAGGAVTTGATAAAAIPTVGAAAVAMPATAPAGTAAGASIGTLKAVANVIVAHAILIGALSKAVVVGNPTAKDVTDTMQRVGAYLQTPEGQETARKAIKIGKDVTAMAIKAMSKNPAPVVIKNKEIAEVFKQSTALEQDWIQRLLQRVHEDQVLGLIVQQFGHEAGRLSPAILNYARRHGLMTGNPAKETHLLNFDLSIDAVKRTLKMLGKEFTPENVNTLKGVLEGTADIDIEYNLDSPKDVIQQLWGEDADNAKPYPRSEKKKFVYWLTVTVDRVAVDKALKELGKPIDSKNRNKMLRALQASADMMIEGDMEDKGTLEYRWSPQESMHRIPNPHKDEMTAGMQDELEGAAKYKQWEQHFRADDRAYFADKMKAMADDELTHYAGLKMMSKYVENPRKAKKQLKLTPLTQEEYNTYEYAIVFYLNDGQPEGRAYKNAWNDTKLEHARLNQFDDVDWEATNKNLGLEAKNPSVTGRGFRVLGRRDEDISVTGRGYSQYDINEMKKRANPLHELAFKAPMMQAEEFFGALRLMMLSNELSGSIGTDAFYQDPNNFMTVSAMIDNDAGVPKVREVAKQFNAEEIKANPAKRGTIAIRELSDKPGRYIVVEEIGGTIVQLLSGVAGQSKEEAEEIAQRIGKRNPARWKKGSKVQSMLFKKRQWTPQQARAWLREHGMEYEDMDPKKSVYRFRQMHPSRIKAGHYGTIPFGEGTGIQAVLGEPNPKKIITIELIEGVIDEVKGLPQDWEFEVYDVAAGQYGGPPDYADAMTEHQIRELEHNAPPRHELILTLVDNMGTLQVYHKPPGYKVMIKEFKMEKNPEPLSHIKHMIYASFYSAIQAYGSNDIKTATQLANQAKGMFYTLKSQEQASVKNQIGEHMFILLDVPAEDWKRTNDKMVELKGILSEYMKRMDQRNPVTDDQKRRIQEFANAIMKAKNPKDKTQDWLTVMKKTYKKKGYIAIAFAHDVEAMIDDPEPLHFYFTYKGLKGTLREQLEMFYDRERTPNPGTFNTEMGQNAEAWAREQVISGAAREKYGLETDSGSRYYALRERGLSDEDAQFEIFGNRLISEYTSRNPANPTKAEATAIAEEHRAKGKRARIFPIKGGYSAYVDGPRKNPENPTKFQAQTVAEFAREHGKRARVLETADKYNAFVSKDVLTKRAKKIRRKKAVVPKVAKAPAVKREKQIPITQMKKDLKEIRRKIQELNESGQMDKAKELHPKRAELEQQFLKRVAPAWIGEYGHKEFVPGMEQFKAPVVPKKAKKVRVKKAVVPKTEEQAVKAQEKTEAMVEKVSDQAEKQVDKVEGMTVLKVPDPPALPLYALVDVTSDMTVGGYGEQFKAPEVAFLKWLKETDKVWDKLDKQHTKLPAGWSDQRKALQESLSNLTLVQNEVKANFSGVLFGLIKAAKAHIIEEAKKIGYDIPKNKEEQVADTIVRDILDLDKKTDKRAKLKDIFKYDLNEMFPSKPAEEGGKLKLSDIPMIVRKIMPRQQVKVIVGSEEFWGIVKKLEEQAKEVPKLYSQEKLGNLAIVHMHYFYGGTDVYVTEWDGEDEYFGYTILNGDYQNSEFGYSSRPELVDNGKIELDFHWKPKPLQKALENISDYYKETPEEPAAAPEPKAEEPVVPKEKPVEFVIQPFGGGPAETLTLPAKPTEAYQAPPPPPEPEPAAPAEAKKPQISEAELAKLIAKELKEQMG